MTPSTTYERLGGEEGLRRLVDRFYDLMAELPETRGILSLHPRDLTDSRTKLFKFLSGLFGGPSLYIQEYGHPMLRARHLPFPIGVSERDQWLLCMNRAIDELVADAELGSKLKENFFRTADHMRNREENDL
ncbi:group II truncated hemoglobin [Rubripirellula sp.]|nr:group II truncated hemoglobin [Rubripirellula sp.]